MQPEKKSVNEERIRNIAPIYYSRPAIRQNILAFSKNREISPRYFEGFGKRPDTLSFESDVLELVKKGATSFHCSEEIWRDPLELNVELSEQQLISLRTGWDLLIDIDSKYFDYSKIYAELLIKILNQEGITNIGIKFSGSKGFHLIIPWKAFPEQVSGSKTKEMFPEWPRLICRYLSSKLTNELKERVLDLETNKQKKEDQIEFYCQQCKSAAQKSSKVFLQCIGCNTTSEVFEQSIKRKRIIRCPNCQKQMQELRRQPILICETCNLNSKSSPSNFKERVKKQTIDADIVLVSSRHLFRMPYSLHEKTSLASVVIPLDKIKDFQLKDAHPLKIKTPLDFYPNAKPGEASNLLIHALEAKKPEEEEYVSIASRFQDQFQSQKSKAKKSDFKKIIITNLTEDLYPPTIKAILKGMPEDGRKRALFILLNYFRSLNYPNEKIEQTILEWNKKNYHPLKGGYIKSQLSWHFKTNPKLPPNYDKPHYKEIGLNPTTSEIKAKNPVSYTIRISFAKEHDKEKK